MMKRKVFFNIFFSIALAMLSFLAINFAAPKTSLAEDNVDPAIANPIFDYVSIAQQGRPFTIEDFIEQKTTNGTTTNKKYYLYSTESITIYNYNEVKNGTFSIWVTDSNNTSLTPEDYAHEITTTNEKNEQITRKYYVFPIQDFDSETIISLRYSVIKQQQTQNGIVTQPVNYDFSFHLIQVAENFALDDDLYWDYTYNNVVETVKSPTNGYIYPNLNLHIPNGTEVNPISVRFNYLGSNYEVYNIGGTFYNSIDNTPINNMDHLEFNLSGFYTVEIFDNTINDSDHQNYLKHEFTIESRKNPFYISANLEDGTVLMHRQTSNDDIIINFNNLQWLVNTNSLDRISVDRNFQPTVGEHINESTDYSVRNGNLEDKLILNKDGSYTITVYNKQGKSISSFEVTVVKTIRTSFTFANKLYSIPENVKPNEIYTPAPIEKTELSHYKNDYHDIKGNSTYTFSISLANSAPSIIGIDNNARTQKNVSLKVTGVGKIKVVITKDGVTLPETQVENGSTLSLITEPGKYLIRITDEMGTTITKNFTITIKMNAAATALIVIGIILVVIAIIIIIIMRSKIKVR